MVFWGLEPGLAGWKVQKNPLSYGGTQCDQIGRFIGLWESF